MLALFIDDDALNRTVMAAMLSAADVTMEEASNGPDGLRQLEAGSFDFVLVDLRMPSMDGYEVVRRIRSRHDEKGRLPVVVVTADESDNLEEQCLAAGADAVIRKPVEMDRLFETVGALLASGAGTPI